MMKAFYRDKLRVFVFPTRQEMGARAAADAAAAIRALLGKKQELNIMFGAAPSQDDVIRSLVEDGSIDFGRVNAFHMDEYVGLAEGHPQSFASYLNGHLFHLRQFRSVHFIRGDAPDPEAECRRYEELLRKHPTDIVMMGVGENGHIAFNDPPVADFQDPHLLKVVELEERCRMQQVHDGCFPSLEKVPTRAITVTVPGLMRAAHQFCVVPTRLKAQAVRDLLQGPVGEACPATALRHAESATLYLDRDSASLLDEAALEAGAP